MSKTEVLNNDLLTVRVDETPLEVVEEHIESAAIVVKNNPLLVAGVAVAALAIGGYVGYRIGVKRTTLKYEDILTEEVAKAKAFYKRLAKEDEFETPEGAVEALVPSEVVSSLKSYQGKDKNLPYNTPEAIPEEEKAEVVVEEKLEVRNVFKQARVDPRDWDYNAEIAQRNPEKPYVISFEEFQENEEANEQNTLTYYEADDTLTDEREVPIDNTEYTVGDDNLTRFGHGSGDANVVYIRNEKIGCDFEVVRSKGSYQREVLGMEPESPKELRHAHRREARRRRGLDE